jgi:hypothetical protein
MIYGEPETLRFLAAVQRIKKLKDRKERLTRLAKDRVREALREIGTLVIVESRQANQR